MGTRLLVTENLLNFGILESWSKRAHGLHCSAFWDEVMGTLRLSNTAWKTFGKSLTENYKD